MNYPHLSGYALRGRGLPALKLNTFNALDHSIYISNGFYNWELKMYIKTKCSVCGTNQYHNLKLHALEETHFTSLDSATNYTVENIEVTDTATEEELAHEILKDMRSYVHDGIDVRDICRTLKKSYGVAAAYCCDLVARLKIEMDMYCPDRHHLYFVKTHNYPRHLLKH